MRAIAPAVSGFQGLAFLRGGMIGEINEGFERNLGLANLHARTRNRLQHPSRNDDDIAGCRLDVSIGSVSAPIDALTPYTSAKKRMMWVMNGHKFADMG